MTKFCIGVPLNLDDDRSHFPTLH